MIDHSTLPSIANARLPRTYEAAKHALSQCDRVDECENWADKMQALASYAKQSKDQTLEHMAKRIRARAIRRAGELLKRIEKGTGKYQSKRDAADPLDRKSAADSAGLSERDRKTALRVANVDAESFEKQVESDSPPTVTQLAEQGKKKTKSHVPDGVDPKDFTQATQVIGTVTRFAEDMRSFDFASAKRGMYQKERAKCLRTVLAIDSLLDRLAVTLQGE